MVVFALREVWRYGKHTTNARNDTAESSERSCSPVRDTAGTCAWLLKLVFVCTKFGTGLKTPVDIAVEIKQDSLIADAACSAENTSNCLSRTSC